MSFQCAAVPSVHRGSAVMRDGGGSRTSETVGGLKDFKAGETDLDLLITCNMSLSHSSKPMKILQSNCESRQEKKFSLKA